MFSVPDGLTANQPFVDRTFIPPIDAPLPGAFVILSVIGSPAISFAVIISGDRFAMATFSVADTGVSILVYHGFPNCFANSS